MLTYTYRYNRTIQWFRDHPITKESHPDSEVHHIVPQSCGGEDVKENKVLLPTRWHYIVHCWLPAVYLEQGNQEYYEKMLFAWNRMQNYREDFRSGLQTIKEYSWLYQKLRSEYNKILRKKMSFAQSGKKNSQYGKRWWKDPNDKTKELIIKEGDPVPEGWIPGHWHNSSLETREKISNIRKGKISITDGKRAKIVNSLEEIPEGWYRGIPERSLEARQKMSKSAIAQGKRYREKHAPIWREKLLPMLECFYSEGFAAVKEKFDYKYTAQNLCQLFRKYLPEEYNAKKKRINKKSVQSQ